MKDTACHVKCKLSVCGFSIATALVSGLGVLILGLMATFVDIGGAYVTVVGSVYKGYAATAGGSLIGGIWAFFNGLICGFFFSLFYNGCIRRCHCSSCKPSSCIKE